MSLTQSVWVPFGAALLGAVAGAGISWRALAWNAGKEWKRRQAQARRALLVEMLMNAQRLRTGAIVQRHAANVLRRFADLQGKAADLQHRGGDVSEVANNVAAMKAAIQETTRANVLAGRNFSAAFHGYFTEATEGVAWEDVKCVVDAYGVGEVLFEGSLVVDPVGTGADLYRDNADSFCKAIRAVSKYESLEDAFYEEVGKVEKWLA